MGMRRISQFSIVGFVAWFFVGEAVLAYLHLGEFAVRFVEDLFAWVQTHFFADLFIGLGLLFLNNQWPNIKPRLPSWLKFRTVHGRLHTIEEEHLPAIRESHGVITTRLADMDSLLSGRLADIDQHAKTLDILSDNTAVQNRHKSSDPCCKRGTCVPGTGILRLRSAAVS